MTTLSLSQYLTDIKTLVDNITAVGSYINPEDIMLYTLNGFPPQYQAFKASIQTKHTPISLEDLYSLLISEEINILAESAKYHPPPSSQSVFYALVEEDTESKVAINLPYSAM
ncbi:hypothetical protein KFK09_027490 [Dendrobium nobile]|uniref:UBN2 domain-containing protein n=1 Tax=Dendrobium nobile TaxID=94219 RepID=A0A8T3AAZ1_DENNO|nr:hypothetical protein KFK09_027490 [Dendrobium nobile]